MNNTTSIFVRLSKEQRDKLKLKASKYGLTISQYIRKIASEEVLFLDENLMKVLSKFSIDLRS